MNPSEIVRLDKNEASTFFKLLTPLLSAGLTLRESIVFAAKMAASKKLKSAFLVIGHRLASGKSFSKLLENHIKGIPALGLSLCAVAEQSGKLTEVFEHLDQYLTRKAAFRSQLQSALMYPLLVLGFALLGLLGLNFFALPALRDFAQTSSGPIADRLLQLSQKLDGFLGLASIFALLVVLSVLVATFFYRSQTTTKLWFDRFFLSVPLLGSFFIRQSIHDFCFATELLLSSGIPLAKAIYQGAQGSFNFYFKQQLLKAHHDVVAGRVLSLALHEHAVFLPEYIQWVAIGEKTGTHQKVFAQLRNFSGQWLEGFLTRISKLAEPVVTLVMGLMMIFFVVFFVIPLFDLYGGLI